MPEDLSDLIVLCKVELKRLGLTWRSDRVQTYCEKATGFRDAHYFTEAQLQTLLVKLQAEHPKIEPGVRVKAGGYNGVVQDWDEDIQSWSVLIGESIELFDVEELEIAA